MSLTRQVIFLLPLGCYLSKFIGIDGVMYAGPIADAAAFVLAVVFARRELSQMKNEYNQRRCHNIAGTSFYAM